LGKRVEKFAIIPSKEGQLTIPAIELKWWDTKNNVEKTASIPARTFNVTPGEPSAQTPINLPTIPVQTTQTVTVDNDAVKLWQMVSAALFVLWLLTLIAYINKRRTKPAKKQVSKSSKMTDDHTVTLKDAKQAIKNGSADEIAKSIIAMVNSLKKEQFHSLGSIAHKVVDSSLIKKLNALDEQSYSASQQSLAINITNEDLLKIIDSISCQPKNAGYSAIPPLYAR